MSQELLQGLEAGWQEATVGHKFIKACVDGSIRPEQFNTWLAQVRKQQLCLWQQLAQTPAHCWYMALE